MTLAGSAGSGRFGLLLAALILLGWLISLIGLLRFDLLSLPLPALLAAVLLRTFLQTGLFIVGHDAMHGVLLPLSSRWNDRLGALALALYAALPYRRCRLQHQRHHRCTASTADPDFHPDPRAGFLAWYGRFMAGYLSAGQMGRLLAGWASVLAGCLLAAAGPFDWAGPLALAGPFQLAGLFQLARPFQLAAPLDAAGPLRLLLRVLLVCTLPLLLSSLQLFGFGTYLPHRAQRAGLSRPQATAPASLNLPGWLSLLSCFHFGYHLEHHQNPELAWFALPAQRRRRLAALATAGAAA